MIISLIVLLQQVLGNVVSTPSTGASLCTFAQARTCISVTRVAHDCLQLRFSNNSCTKRHYIHELLPTIQIRLVTGPYLVHDIRNSSHLLVTPVYVADEAWY